MKKQFLAVLLAAGAMTGCSGMESKQAVAADAPVAATQSANNEDLYVVYHDGRINIFYDFGTYMEFMSVGETAFRKTLIGAGPNGETLMYGLTKADKKKASGIPSIDMMEGRLAPAADFYGEIVADGRINVFDDWSLFKEFMQHGEVPYRLTDIGAGPNGETLVYALTKETKKKRPEALIAKFKTLHAMK